MRHLLLYEAFKAKGISKTLKYLSDNDIDTELFLNDLKKFMTDYDIPISEITDDDIHYMNKKKALKIKKPDDYEIMNPNGVYTIKFWFSVSDGYLGCSLIGDESKFSNELFLKIDGVDGRLVKLDYDGVEYLKTGDIIYARFDTPSSPMIRAVIFKEGRNAYAIQDKHDGASPNYSDDWLRFGRYSWIIGSSDTFDLHLLEKNKEDEIILSRSIPDKGVIEDSDFSLVIYLDELVEYESVKDIRVSRTDAKSGALALMSPDEIKKANYERYMMEILKEMGFEKDSKFDDLKNLQKIAQKVVVGDWAFFSIWSNEPGISYIKNFSNNIRYKEINRIIGIYNNISKDYLNIKKRFIGSNQRVKNLANKDSKNIFNIYYDLSIKLNNKIKNSNLETLEDLILIHYKLDSLRSFLKSDVSISKGMVKLLDNFYYNDSDVDYGIELLNSEDDLEKDEKAYKLIDRFIEKLF